MVCLIHQRIGVEPGIDHDPIDQILDHRGDTVDFAQPIIGDRFSDSVSLKVYPPCLRAHLFGHRGLLAASGHADRAVRILVVRCGLPCDPPVGDHAHAMSGDDITPGRAALRDFKPA